MVEEIRGMEDGGGPGVPMVTPLEMAEEGTCYDKSVCVCVCDVCV